MQVELGFLMKMKAIFEYNFPKPMVHLQKSEIAL